MRIHLKTTFDIETGAVLADEFYEYDGPLALAGGGGTQKAQMNLQNSLQQQSLDRQNANFDSVKGSVSPYLSGNKGFTDQQMAALNSSALDQNAQRYNEAGQSVRQALLSRGENGASPMSGNGVAGIAGLQSGKASDLANALRTVQLNNAQTGTSNMWNANSVLSGQAQTQGQNNSVFGAGANNALNQFTQAQANSFGGSFMKSLGGGLGGGLAGMATGGLAGGIGGALSGTGAKAGAGTGMMGW